MADLTTEFTKKLATLLVPVNDRTTAMRKYLNTLSIAVTKDLNTSIEKDN